MTGHISVPLDEAQKAQLEAIAETNRESVGDLAARAIRDFLEEDAAFRGGCRRWLGRYSGRPGR
jgi:hypothetical protein